MPVPLLLHGTHRSPVTYEPFGPWIVPWRFASFEDEYQTLRTATGLLDYSTQAVIEVNGADRTGFLHRLLTNDIACLAPGAGCRTALLTPSAKLIADLVLLADTDSTWLLCDLQRAALVAQTLERYVFSEQVTVANHERETSALALQGPRTVEALTRLLGTVVSLPHPGDHAVIPLEGLLVRWIRHTLTGDAGVLALVSAENAEAVWRLLRDRGLAVGVRPAGWEALNAARIEAGLPWFGMDMDDTNLLPETGLETVAASETKGCYLGQEIVARMRTYGSATKRLMGVLMEGDRPAQPGDRMVRGGEEAGWVTSACYSPALKRPVALGYLKRGAYEPGTAVEIVRGQTRIAATVAARPFVPSQ